MSYAAEVLSYCDMTESYYLPARYYALMAAHLHSLGTDMPGLLRDAGIAAETLAQPDAQLTPTQVDQLVHLGIQRTGRSDLGFETGKLIRLSSHDILGYAVLSAATVDAALRLLSRYFSLITPTYRMAYRRHPQQVEILFTPTLPISSLTLQVHLEVIAVAIHDHLNTLLAGGLRAAIVELSYDAPPHAARYRELHGIEVRFAQGHLPGARVLLDPALVQRPLALSDANALRMAEARCAALLNQVTNRSSLGDWLHGVLREASEGQPALEELAGILNLSPRTLERRLAQEGKSFRQIANRARHDRACDLLRADRLNVTQIAYQLGYTDAANFTRAFRREAGVSPSDYRRALETQTAQGLQRS